MSSNTFPADEPLDTEGHLRHTLVDDELQRRVPVTEDDELQRRVPLTDDDTEGHMIRTYPGLINDELQRRLP